MSGKKWINLNSEKAEEIEKYLEQAGGIQEVISSASEIYRIKISNATVTYYKNGTLYSTFSDSKNPIINCIDKIAGSVFVEPSKEFLIGLDETGKGELVGNIHIVGVFMPSTLFHPLKDLVGIADTKKSHSYDYWDNLFNKISSFFKNDLKFVEEKISPFDADKYNLNKIMDVTYQKALSSLVDNVDISNCRITIDDYGIGDTLKTFFGSLEGQKAEIIVAPKSDDKYIETKLASLISKREREKILKSINENPEYIINGLSVGSGNAGDKQTINWLKEWHSYKKPWPWFIKKSFSTIRQIEGFKGKAKKLSI